MGTATRIASYLAAAAMFAAGAPAWADVKDGVDAWARGDYAKAVAEWRGPAAAGDPDAQFNMAQAYRLGRGVEENSRQAEILYAKAAAQGHLKAADNYGILLFQSGRREEAMPYVKGAAERGDPRSQYLLGIAHFNGELVEKDWERAYALMTLANGAGLPQAPPALAQMDDFIPIDTRERAQILAQQIKRDSDTRRAQQMAAADLAIEQPQGAPAAPVQPIRRLPQPIAGTNVPPSIAAARTAIEEASRVTGTESPATAGADYARPRTAQAPAPQPAAAPAARPAPAPAPTAMSGPWRVQLGAFSVRANADKLWNRVAGNSALAGAQKLVVPAGNLVRLQAGGFASRSAAQSACDTLKRAGQNCLVTR
ncbi:SPOR domain-containing protein [Erythrobacter sp. HKB08]|uniref:SPOR domain-containing protein n=1 Tax=Erythrobacter sp. HKB08 TaxID=2502843 RepID=UPI0018F8B56B|nr:SPOR domain-containing protein [Erythrobacter sp. HKB08]